VARFCLIAGNWHDGSSWKWLVPPLRVLGHEVVAPTLPTDDPKAGWERRIEPAMHSLDEVKGPAVIVAHSASSECGAIVAARLDDPLLVHLCPRLGSFDPPRGAPEPFRPGFPFPPRRPDGANVWDRGAAMQAMYGRLPREVAEELADRLRPAAPAPDDFPLPGHPDVPTALIYASEDEFFEPDWERLMAREVLGVEPIEIPGGHFPMAENPEALAEILDGLAREHARPR
jgi:pimeloyl-ACP methyl ester carboxylesterase